MTAIPATPATPTAPAAQTAGARGAVEIDPRSCRAMMAGPGTVLVDVREADEHARERIAGARSMPLSRLDAKEVAALGAHRVIFHCRGGRRSLDAATRCAAIPATGIEIHSMLGGIEAWKREGLPTEVDEARPRMGTMQQTQVVIGATTIATVALGAFVHPAFLALPALLGAGMIRAGLTGNCGFANLLGKLPWNRGSACAQGTCARDGSK